MNIGICEMSGCDKEMERITGDKTLYGSILERSLGVCEECFEEYTDMDAYGRPDYASSWLIKSQKEIKTSAEAQMRKLMKGGK